MCGRYTLYATGEALWEEFDLEGEPEVIPPRYNVAPTQDVIVVGRREGRAPRLGRLRWGLIPPWAKDPGIGAKMINARSESLADKPAFRRAYARRRCLVVADGFYEWKKLPGGAKQPMYVSLASGRPFGFAGLWESWAGPDGEKIFSCAIVTGDARGAIADIHPRMPLIVRPEDRAAWLDPAPRSSEVLAPLLARCLHEELRARPVSTRVNKVDHDGPENLEPPR